MNYGVLRVSIWLGLLFLVSSTTLLCFGDFTFVDGANGRFWHTSDDHMITQRVAENFWNYGKPFFNINEAVAANTSLFWPMFLSMLYAVGSNSTAIPLVILFSVGMSAASIVFASTLISEKLLQFFGVVLLSLSPSFLAYGPSGWEHIPQMLLLTISLLLVADVSRRAGHLSVPFLSLIFASISFVFRIDSAPFILVLVLLWLHQQGRYLRFSSYLKLAPLLSIPAAYLITMHHYYGQFFPNTATLKIHSLSEGLALGLQYIVNPFKSGMVPLLALAALLIRPKRPFTKLLLFLVAIQSVYIVSVGGDVFAKGRFFIIFLPILFFTLAEELKRRIPIDTDRTLVVGGLATAIVAFLAAPDFIKWTLMDGFEEKQRPIVEQMRVASVLNCALEPDDGSIGLHYLGIGYHMPKFHVVDFLGKADPVIASRPKVFGPIGHDKWDYDYSFATYDIAAVPINKKTVDHVRDSDFQLQNKNFMFWEIAIIKMEEDKIYEFVPPDHFGNTEWGAYVKRNAVEKLLSKECL
jgi:hypothetical protein